MALKLIERIRKITNRPCPKVLVFVLGLLLGGVLGARYLSETVTAQFLLGTFLPPYARNLTGSSNRTAREWAALKKGMSKGEVLRILKLQRVDILTANEMADWQERAGERDYPAGACEIWRIPMARHGVSEYLYLGFDDKQALLFSGVNEFMLGFPAKDLPGRR